MSYLLGLGWLLMSQAQAATLGVVLRSENMPSYPQGMQILQDSEIRTGKNQKVAVKTTQGDILAADSNSIIKLVKPGFFQHLLGKIYFLVAPRKNNNVRVETRTATLGIRGTRFLVDSQNEADGEINVALSEGQLNIESKGGRYFQLYEQRELSEYEKYKRNVQNEFDTYKQQVEEEFVAYKKSFDLDSGFSLVFDGSKVVRRVNDENVDSQFEAFEAFINQKP